MQQNITNGKPGFLIPIGGAEDKKVKKLILTQVWELFGGEKARIAVLPTASLRPSEAFALYESVFGDLGVAAIDNLDVATRKQAQQSEITRILDDATGIFITGGNQLRLSAILGGTPLADKIRERFFAGVTVAGTSAGASVLSQHMIAFGRNGSRPSLRMLQLAPGFGLINPIIIDQHFRERDRIGRLQTAVTLNPRLIGLGIDEDTAVIIRPDNIFEVIGSGSITVVDGSTIEYTDIHKIKRHTPIAIIGMTLHVLTQGHQYNLTTRSPVQQEPEKPAAAQPARKPRLRD